MAPVAPPFGRITSDAKEAPALLLMAKSAITESATVNVSGSA